jgi:predicted Zn-dependent protease
MKFKNQFRSIIKEISYTFEDHTLYQYRKPIISVICGILLLGGSWAFVRWYYTRQSQNMYASLSKILLKLQVAQDSPKTDWVSFEKDFLADVLNDGNLANNEYSKMLQVNILIKQGKKNDAYILMEELAFKEPETMLTPFLKIKYALMLLESKDTEKGIDLLNLIVQEKKSLASDIAQYEKGRYFFLQGDFANAKSAWQDLVDTQTMEQKDLSIWAQLAEQKLNQIP